MSKLEIQPLPTIEENAYDARMHFLKPFEESQDVIQPYEPLQPAPPRYSLIRPEGYKTPDAETLTLRPGSAERVACFISALVRPVEMPGSTDSQQWLQWGVHGVQSVDTTLTAEDSVRFFIDKDVDKDHVKRLMLRHDTAAWFVRQMMAGEDSESIVSQLSDYFKEHRKQIEQAKPLVDSIDMIFERDHNLGLDKTAKLRLHTVFVETLEDSANTRATKCHTCTSSDPVTIDSLTPKP